MEQLLIDLETYIYTGMIGTIFFVLTILWIFHTHGTCPMK